MSPLIIYTHTHTHTHKYWCLKKLRKHHPQMYTFKKLSMFHPFSNSKAVEMKTGFVIILFSCLSTIVLKYPLLPKLVCFCISSSESLVLMLLYHAIKIENIPSPPLMLFSIPQSDFDRAFVGLV